MDKKRVVIAVYVENKYGVLTRVTSMFTRRGFNIDTLAVGETESPDYSRITISLHADESEKKAIVNQLKKLYNVRKVEVIDDEIGIRRELLLLKVKNNPETRSDVKDCVEAFRAKIVDYNAESLCLEMTGDTNKLNAFIENMKPFGIIELCRTGIVAIERGPDSILSK